MNIQIYQDSQKMSEPFHVKLREAILLRDAFQNQKLQQHVASCLVSQLTNVSPLQVGQLASKNMNPLKIGYITC